MGVPGLWRWLQQQFPGAFRAVGRLEGQAHTLLLDLNGMIHEAMRREGTCAAVLEAVDAAVAAARPRHTVFLAIDGVAPRAKAREQRARRAQYTVDGGGGFSPLDVTAGSAWLAGLERRLRGFVGRRRAAGAWGGVRVVLSGREDAGEGEHKIAAYLRAARGPCVVWSGDGDAVLLALAARAPATVVVRGQPAQPASVAAVSIDALRALLCARYGPAGRRYAAAQRTVDDLVLVALLAGSDALPPLPAAAPAPAGCAVAELWDAYRAAAAAAGPAAPLHDRGAISAPALCRLLDAVAHAREDRAFHRHVGATPLGAQIADLRARRHAWAAHAPPARKRPRARSRPAARRRPAAWPPLVWTGSAAAAATPAVRDALLRDGRPLAAPPEHRPAAWPPLAVDGRPLLPLALAPAAAWVLLCAAGSGSVMATGSDSVMLAGIAQLPPDAVASLAALAAPLGLALRCCAAGDAGFDAAHERWRRQRAAGDPGAAQLSPAVRAVLEVRRTAAAATAAATATAPAVPLRLVSVVGDREWRALLADADIDRRCAEERAAWRAAHYWHRDLTPDQLRARLCAWYAGMLAWSAALFFDGRVPSWSLAADHDMAPLASDLADHVRALPAWPAPPPDPAPPLLAEHLLSVLPPAAWPHMLPPEHAALARHLHDADYSHDAHAHVSRALARLCAPEAPIMYIWL
ncbi:exonuclease II Exo2 [Coemansia javaensis]|uniref:Exonuclease II Exo2 n=1 Tax=Coemansia javaensis TaxID=2761396 RepID=A0A9W8H767_9FUNG|nr:exonuclease II Exo2 [Coemansia javaensis]